MNVKGLPLRRSVTEAAKVRFQIEFAPQYEGVRERQIFDEAASARERSSPQLIPISTGPIPVLRLQAVERRRGFTQSTLVQPH